ncbi:MAG: hypothetical protein LLG04_07645 [Parachlamydia sp.]|nr:hypothetical protein [Parachlamydia sp.]
MATKKEIDKNLKIALEEVGAINPWFDKEVNCWVFSHKDYPVEYGGDSVKEVVKNYPKYLREFIAHRLDGRISKTNETETKGRGGVREGAGRPKGSKSAEPTIQIRVPADIAAWLKTPGMIGHVRGMLAAYRSLGNKSVRKSKMTSH